MLVDLSLKTYPIVLFDTKYANEHYRLVTVFHKSKENSYHGSSAAKGIINLSIVSLISEPFPKFQFAL